MSHIMHTYEGVFILEPTLEKDAQEKIAEDIKGMITKGKGTVANVQTWGKRRLAYLIKKKSEGVYYLFDFSLPPEATKKMEAVLKLNEAIIRFMIIRKDA